MQFKGLQYFFLFFFLVKVSSVEVSIVSFTEEMRASYDIACGIDMVVFLIYFIIKGGRDVG